MNHQKNLELPVILTRIISKILSARMMYKWEDGLNH
jgi:hypothetical protein